VVIAHTNRRTVRPKGGKREDLEGLFLRSAMEANVARIFEALRLRTVVIQWWYEPHVYLFAEAGYRRGPWAYTPDFLVQWNPIALGNDLAGWADILPGKRPEKDMPFPGNKVKRDRPRVQTIRGEYFEVKGREMPSDRSKAKRMAKHFADVRVTQIGRHEYLALAMFWFKLIPMWEGGRR
jgi:hypothetical protein